MSRKQITPEQLIDSLRAEELLQLESEPPEPLRPGAVTQPWYVRTLVGFGAWLASLLLIGFVTSLSAIAGGGYGIIGVILITSATLIRREYDSDFLTQCAMASSLAGQALLAYSISDTLGRDELEVFLAVALVVSMVLLILYPDRIHRVLMLLLSVGCAVSLLYAWEAQALIPFLGPLLTALLLLLQLRLPQLVSGRLAPLLQPLTSGLMLSAFGVLMLSTLYLLPELGTDKVFYPRPWISTLLLGAELLYLAQWIAPAIDGGDSGRRTLLYLLVILITAAAWYAPGLLLGLIVLLLGAQTGRATFVGAGIGFFALFLAAFFYGIEIGLLTKSITLIASGLVLLLSRWAPLRVMQAGGGRHA